MISEKIVPDELRLAITRKCTGKCRHCYNSSGKNTDRLSTASILQLIQETHYLNPKFNRITVTGGEPLLEKQRVLDIALLCKSRGIKVRLVTRGWELDENLCRQLKEAGVSRIQIGLDSSGKLAFRDEKKKRWDTFHSWLRAEPDAFEKTIDSIKMATQAGLNVSVRFSACKSNLKDLIQTYKMVSVLGVSKFKFRLLFPDGRAKKTLAKELLTGAELAAAQLKLIRSANSKSAEVEITQPCFFGLGGSSIKRGFGMGENTYKQACSCGSIAAYIDSNGDVKYCLFDENVLGNLFDAPFLSIWNSQAAARARGLRSFVDRSGVSCSSFKVLYEKHGNYPGFMRDYYFEVQKNMQLGE